MMEALPDDTENGVAHVINRTTGIDHGKPVSFLLGEIEEALSHGLMEFNDHLVETVDLARGLASG